MLGKIWKIMADIEDFARSESDSIYENVKFIACISLVTASVSAIEVFFSIPRLTGLPFGFLSRFAPPVASILAFLIVITGGIALLLAGSLVLHALAILFGGKGKYSDTVPAMVAFLAPNLLLGWIPLVNIWTSIYTFLIIVYVLAVKQKISMAKATLAIAIPIIVLTVIAGALGLIGAGGMVQTLVPVPGV